MVELFFQRNVLFINVEDHKLKINFQKLIDTIQDIKSYYII